MDQPEAMTTAGQDFGEGKMVKGRGINPKPP